MSINFRELEMFWAVFRTGSIKKAAEALNVTQPAVSMMLRNAEERFDLQLFERIGNRAEPTPEAKALAGIAERVFADLADFESLVGEIRRSRLGFIRVAAAPTFATAVVPAAIAKFRAAHPEIFVILRMVPTKQVIELVASKQVDFGVCYGPADSADVEQLRLGMAEISCVLRDDHPLAAKCQIHASDLKGNNIITYRPDTPLGAALESRLKQSGVDLDILIQATAPNAASMAETGQGIALIDPIVLSTGTTSNLVSRIFKPRTRVPVFHVAPSGSPLSPICQIFWSELKASLERAGLR